MTHREHFFSVLEGAKPERMPFFPDISDWYVGVRTTPGEARKKGCAKFIPDDDPFHRIPCDVPDEVKDLTLFDIYKKFDWGYPVHISDWYDTEYGGDVEYTFAVTGPTRVRTISTPKGSLQGVDKLAYDGTWCPVELYAKEPRDLEIIKLAVEAARYIPRYERVLSVKEQIGGQGLGDIVIWRSPFGKLVQDYMGFENVAYALADDPGYIEDFLQLQESRDLEVIALAAQAPERLVIISDHADQHLISPSQYEKYCMPFYRKACDILHEAGKFVSTHLDGNFKGFFPLLGRTGFDLLDGCTPAPMFNFEVEELAEALPEGMKAYCGVPSTMFCQQLPEEEIFAFADRIMNALKGRGILNVGDILPANGDIRQVIALGRYAAGREP